MGAGSVSGNPERVLCRRAQMTAAVGFATSLCSLGSFRQVSDARSFALKYGKDQGQSCACR